MNKFNKTIDRKTSHLTKKLIYALLAAIIVIIGVSVWYVNDYYHTDTLAVNEYNANLESSQTDNEISAIEKKVLSGGDIAYIPDNASQGIIFYPGGKVEYTAYEPLMEEFASRGILCVLVKMPCNLAVLDMNGADGIQEQFAYINNWYMAGHSLGGAMAASYVAKHTDSYKGLILLGAYSTANLTDGGLNVISIYGSEDKVLNKEKYEKYKTNLPQNYKEYIINGGCHSYYGMYGHQKGDGEPSITNVQQIKSTVDFVVLN